MKEIFVTFATRNDRIEMADMSFKSINSLEAAKNLVANKFFTESVHLYYYSVLQMIKFKLAHLLKNALSYEKQAEKIDLNNASTHDWLFSEIKMQLANPKERTTFHQDFVFLKKERVDADYNERTFDVEEALECQEIAERLLNKIKKIR